MNSCSTTGCFNPKKEGSEFCQTHAAVARKTVNEVSRKQDFSIGAGVRHLHLPDGLPKR